MKGNIGRITVLSLSLLAAAGASVVQAATPSSTTVTNTTTVNYQVGGVNQAPRTATSNFVVDNVVLHQVTRLDFPSVSATAGAGDVVLRFRVQNNGNTVQDYAFEAQNVVGSDDFDADNIQVFVDGNGNGTYEAGTDTAAFIDELAPGPMRTVFVVADVPAGTLNAADTAEISLVAEARIANNPTLLGSTMVNNSGDADSPGVVQTVFADETAGSADVAFDGKHSANGVISIATANLVITTTKTVFSDQVNGTTRPKAIPNARITYEVKVENQGTATAENVSFVDQLDENIVPLTFGGIFQVVHFVDEDTTTTTVLSPAMDADNGVINATARTVTVSNLTIGPGESVTVVYRAEIQ